MLLQEVQSGHNVHLYKAIGELIGDKIGPAEKVRDQAWIDRVQEQNDKALEKLEVGLVLPIRCLDHMSGFPCGMPCANA